MDNSYNVKLKKGNVEVEVYSSDKEFISGKFSEILSSFGKSEVSKSEEISLQLQPIEASVQEVVVNAPEPVSEAVTVENSQATEPMQQENVSDNLPLQEASDVKPVEEVIQAVEAVQPETSAVEVTQAVEQPVQEVTTAVAETVQVVEPVKQEEVTVESTSLVSEVAPQEISTETNQTLQPVEPVQEAQAPHPSKSALANAAQVNEDALSKVYDFKKDGFKASKLADGTTALKQINMTKLVLVASEYLNGVSKLSGKALGKHMKSIGTGNLATNLKKDAGIVKDKSFYSLNDVGKQSALELIRTLSKD